MTDGTATAPKKPSTKTRNSAASSVVAVPKTEDEKSLRGTVSIFKNPKTGMMIYARGKKLFMKSREGLPTKEVDTITAAYTARREFAEAKADAGVTIHPKLAKCKWGAEASLKLERMMKR